MKIQRWISSGVLFASVALASCGNVDSTEVQRGQPVERTALFTEGKADGSSLSCVGVCGKQAAGGCWCDELCTQYGDCCADKVAACAPKPVASCEGYCGKKAADGCWCDELCAQYGDCCADKDATCKPTPPPPPPKPKCYIGGCSGQICSDIPGVVTTCEWKPEYACYQNAKCGNYGADNACSWKQTSTLKKCLASANK